MAKGKNELDDLKLDDLDLGKFDLDFDPINDKRKPIIKISSSFSKSMMEEFTSTASIRKMLTAALPTGYGKALNTLSDITASAKKLYATAATELKPVTPDIKRAVQKVLPNTKKVLPDSVTNKLDAMSKPDPDRPSAPDEEDKQNGEIASSLGEVFKTQMQYTAEQDARKGAYRQVRDQIADDQFRLGYAASAQMGAGIQRLVAYQDEVTARYQRKSLELQYRQYFATRELVRITAMTATESVTQLKTIVHNTALPDFAKSNEFGKLENTLAKRMAASMFPQSQQFLSKYFANFTNEMGNRVRENLNGFIDGLRGVQDIASMAEGMDKHTLAGHVLGSKAGEFMRDKGSKFLKKHFDKSKLIKHFGHKLSFKLGNVPAFLGNFAKDYTDHTDKHGAVLGTLMNFMRDILPPVGEGSHVVGGSTLLKSDEAVSFNLATRQALTDVIPGFLSRIHHELMIMRTGDASVARLSWNPVKGTFTTTKALAKDVHKHVYNKDEIDRVRRYSGDFVNKIDPHGKLSKGARDALQKRAVDDAIAGRPMNTKDLATRSISDDPKVAREINEHMRKTMRLRADGSTGKTSRYDLLDAASEAHQRAVSSVPGIKERISALADAGMLEPLIASGHVRVNEDGEYVIDRDSVPEYLTGKKKRANYRDFHRVDPRVASHTLGGMAQAASGGASQAHGEMLDQMKESMAGFEKTADGIVDELRSGRLVEESTKSATSLEKILKVLETRDFSKSNIDALLNRAGGHFNAVKGKVVKWSEDGWAWVQDKAGKVRKVNIKDLAKQSKTKVEDLYEQLRSQHGDKIDLASRKARLFGRFARRKGRGLGSKIASRYHDYMDTPAEGFLGHVGHAVGGIAGAGFQVANLGFRGASAAARGMGRALGMTGKAGWATAKFGGKLSWGGIKGTAKGLHWALLDKISDVYVDGKPIMYAALMKMGRYYVVDKDGKEVKQVNNTDDISGPVKDRETGDFVLTPDQFAKKEYYTRGQKAFSVVKGGVLGAAKLLGNFYAAPFKAARFVGGKAIDALKAVHRFVTSDTDIYVGGEDKPRLYGTRMRRGMYICTTTKEEVHRASDIKGPVQDKETGDILIREEDLKRGLYNAFGHKISRGIGLLWAGAKKVAGLPMALVKGAWKVGKAALGTAASLVGGGLGGLIDHLNRGRAGFDDKKGMKLLGMQLKVQQSIFQILHERMPKPKNIRKGSWEDKFLEESRKEHAAGMGTKGPSTPSSLGGALAGLGAWIKGKFSKDKDKDAEDDQDESLSDKAQSLKDKWDNLKDTWDDLKNGKGKLRKMKRLMKLKKLRGLRRAGKLAEEAKKLNKFGKIGKWGRTAWNAVRGARTLGSVAEGAEMVAGAGEAVAGAAGAAEAVGAGATAASALGGTAAAAAGAEAAVAGVGSAAAAAGGTLAAIFSAPVLLAVGAVAAVGLGAYLAWKWYKGRGPHDLLNVRLAQYGIEKGNSDEVKKVLGLEDALSKNVSIQGGQAVLTKSGLDPLKLMNDFGVSPKDVKAMNAWLVWFKNRFEPIFLNTIAILKQVNPKVELGNADKELKPKEKLEVLKKLRLLPRGIYNVNANPFAAQRSWVFFKVGSIAAGTRPVDDAFAEAEANIRKTVKDDDKGKGAEGKAAASIKGGAAAAATAAGATAAKVAADAKAKAGAGAAADATLAKAGADAKKLSQIGGGTVALVSNVVPIRRPLGSVLSANQCIRYKAYGLNELTNEKVKTLFLLETDVLDKVDVDPKGQAKFNDDPSYYFDTYGSQFGVVNTDAAGRKAWIDWFKARFLPVVLQYATAVTQANPNVKILDAERYLKPDQLLEVAKSVIGTKAGKDYNNLSVWSIATSPWPNFKLNMDAKSTDINIDYLKAQVAKLVYDQKKGIKYTADGGNGEKKDSAGAKPQSGLPSGNDKPKGVQIPKGPTGYSAQTSSGSDGGLVSVNGPSGGPPPGVIIKQPGNGTGGDINKIPMPGQGHSWQSAQATIAAAAKMVGIDPNLLGTIVNIESAFNANAHASSSSAAGYGQFINDTWKAMLAKYGAKYGISPETSQYDPRANALMTAEYVKENLAYLKRATKGEITDTALYLAHFLGPGGAADLLRADRNAVAAQLFPRPAHANPSIFFDNGRPRTVGEVIALMDKKVKTKRVTVDSTAVATTTTTTANGPKGGMGPITGLPSGNGMASSQASAATHSVGPTSPKSRSAAMAGPAGTQGRAGLGPLTSIATTPVPSIDRASSAGDSYASPADASTVVDNRLRMQRTATAADEQARRQVSADNKKAAEMVDILTQSLQAQLSMDTTLKQILKAVTQSSDRGNTANPTDTSPANGVKPAKQSRGSGDMAAKAPIDVSRKTG